MTVAGKPLHIRSNDSYEYLSAGVTNSCNILDFPGIPVFLWFHGIKKTIENVFRKLFLKRAGPLLHIHASSDKNVTKLVTKQGNT